MDPTKNLPGHDPGPAPSPATPGHDDVVAITDEGEATLKYWYPEANRIRLQPANSSMKPIYTRNAQVIGIVTGVVRRVA